MVSQSALALALPMPAWLRALWLLPVLGVMCSIVAAPDWLEPRRLRITLAPGDELLLGREALAALHADSEHLQIRRTAQQDWELVNVAARKAVLWQSVKQRGTQSTRDWPLYAGASFSIGEQRLEVLQVKAQKLVLRSQGQQWHYDGFNLRRNGRYLPACNADWRSMLRHYLTWIPSVRSTWQRPLRLGGGVHCADRLGLPGNAVDSAMIVAQDAGFTLRPGAGTTQQPLILTSSATNAAQPLWQRPIRLSLGDTLIIGRTQYQVSAIAPDLQLTIITRAWYRLATTPPPPLPAGMSITWQAPALWWPALPHGLSAMLLLVSAALLLRYWRTWGALASAVAWVAASVVLYLHSATLPMLWAYALAWGALARWLGAVHSPWSRAALALFTLLYGSGLLALLQLALGAGESGWSRFGAHAAALGAGFGWGAWALRCYLRRGAARSLLLWRWLRVGIYALGAAAILFLLAQAVSGDESGWGGFQPFEMSKLALVLSSAYVLAGASRDAALRRSRTWRVLGYVRPLLLLALLLLVSSFAMIFLRDFSPLVLLWLWSIGLLWAWARAQSRALYRRLGYALALSAISVSSAALLVLQQQPNWFPFDLQAERIQVWAAPELHPHTGYQVRRALDAVRSAGWRGTVWDSAENGSFMHLPAVQDDFMPSFLLQRYGGASALLLVGLQAAWIGILLIIAERARLAGGRGNKLHTFIYLALCGAAALGAAHFLVAWGSNLGFLPVMGQPMPLLSAAGSHLTLLVLPLFALALVTEETIYGHSS